MKAGNRIVINVEINNDPNGNRILIRDNEHLEQVASNIIGFT